MLALTADQLVFVEDRHLATLTTLRADGSPHVVPVAFTWDAVAGRARITTKGTSTKARNVERAAAGGETARAALCQFDGRRWLTLEGSITLSRDPADVSEAVDAYAVRYRRLEFQPERIVLHLGVDRVMGTVR
ncbi:MAG TPA: TIGR03618 family F420-dependent PPOX class oxidoreductase [Cellulomonas sp.]|uniref:pyridoxamine 5'-phosphate oxidase family protein n=1 Tax=Cellulomonas sp. TaxID=40001 RepID=UPI002E2F613E|nr:TIGR03618 family F420-dependent PPOX class oxidoreductase [Cellulomonas sp.]HEX5332104.1 TIGR03618 family F420-dependent PPOX class oxidoreductase [Cellulomonas sp.]